MYLAQAMATVLLEMEQSFSETQVADDLIDYARPFWDGIYEMGGDNFNHLRWLMGDFD
jgi:hypothetical protein